MSATRSRGFRWGRYCLLFGCLLLLTCCALVGRAWWVFRDRFPGYSVAISIPAKGVTTNPRPLRVGFGMQKITPDLSSTKKPVWLAGFSQGRAATGVHDDIWANAVVIDDGATRLGLVVLDAIGLFHDDVIRIRSQITREWGMTYVVVCTTHNHSTPDLMGLWGPTIYQTGVDERYRQHVIDQAVFAIGDAVFDLQPARMNALKIDVDPEGLVADTRKPIVFDPDLRVLHFTHPSSGQTLGTLVGWANHPETPWSQNREITADFPGFLRDALANGISNDQGVRMEGLGGKHVFVNGAVGGLMTTHPSTIVRDPFSDEEIKEPSHRKSMALGHQLAVRVRSAVDAERQNALDGGATEVLIGIQAKTIELPIANNNFLLAGMLGLLDRGHVRWKTVRTEVAFITIGDVSVVTIPGEIYPELVNGGIEKPLGADFDIEPLEVPPIRELMPGRVKFIWGLGNDELGYIIPKSEWDEKPPYLYGANKSPYGEINSPGPETAGLLHETVRELIEKAGTSNAP